MNIFLWALQIILAVHTVIGAIWKFSHTAEQTMPSLAALPPILWRGLSVFEIICAVGLLLPIWKHEFGNFVPWAAAGIAAEMFLFSGLDLFSGNFHGGQIFYWLVVITLCGFLAYGRTKLQPL